MSCWLTKGEEVLENKLATGPGDMARISEALDKLSQRELPKLQIEESSHESGAASGLKVEWARLHQYTRWIGDGFLSPHADRKLFEQSLHIQAAKRQLVTVTKTLYEHALTVEETDLIASLGSSHSDAGREDSELNLGLKDLWSHPEEWVYEDTVLLFEFSPDECLPFGTTHFYRFVAKDALTLEHLPYIEEFFFQAEVGPFDEYSVPATDEIELIAHVFGFMSNL